MASGFIGKIDPFDNSEESWPSYIERAEQFFLVNDIANEKKAPILLTTMGSKTYSLLTLVLRDPYIYGHDVACSVRGTRINTV